MADRLSIESDTTGRLANSACAKALELAIFAMARTLLFGCATVAAAAADSAIVTLSKSVVQPQPIRRNFVGFSIEVDGALKQLTVNGVLRQSYSNLMVGFRGYGACLWPSSRLI